MNHLDGASCTLPDVRRICTSSAHRNEAAPAVAHRFTACLSRSDRARLRYLAEKHNSALARLVDLAPRLQRCVLARLNRVVAYRSIEMAASLQHGL